MKQTSITLIALLSLVVLLGACSGKLPESKKSDITQTPAETTRSFQSTSVREHIPETTDISLNANKKSKSVTKKREHPRRQIEKSDSGRQTSLREWRASLIEDVQTFRVNADQPIRIKGKKGTELFFPALSFADANGNAVHGEIELQLKECYDFLSFFAEGLTTVTSNDELIETGGTIHLQAWQKGRELELLPEAAGVAMFPKNGQEKPGMETFYGETTDNETVVWNAGDPTSGTFFVSNNSMTRPTFVPRSSARLRHTEVTTKKDNDVFARKVTWKLKDSQSTLLKWFEETELTDTTLIRYFRHEGKRLTTTLRFDENGKIKRAGFGKKIPLDVARAMENFLSQAPAVDIKKMGRYKPSSIYMLGLQGWTFNIAPPASAIYAAAGMDSITYTKLNETFNILSLNKMGWINCDRFYRDQRPKVQYAVTAPAETELMVLQFTKIRSQMYGQKAGDCWVFPNLPEGEPVKLVAIAMKGDQRLVTIHPDKISGEKENLVEGEPITDEELANALK